MMTWHVLAGALLGAALGYGGGRLAPRWMEKAPRPWAIYAAALINGVMAGLLAINHPLENYFWQHLVFLSILTTASLVDFHDRIIPNELVLFGLAVGVAMLFVIPAPGQTAVNTGLGALAGFGFLLMLALLVKGGMGLGDVKLAAVMGLFLGYPWIFMALVFSFLAGGFVGGALLLLRIVGRKDHIPFGPWLALGAAITVLYGPDIWSWYLGL